MKPVNLLLAISFLLLSVFSCNKETLLNIDYPAVYIVNGASNSLSVINLTTEKVTETISLKDAKFPHHIYLSPDETQMAVAITNTDLSGGHGAHGGGNSSSNFKVLILNAKTGEVHHTLPVSKLPHNATFSPTGTELWVGQADDVVSKILVFNTTDYKEIASINVGKGLSEVTFSADGTKVFAANTDDHTISIINPSKKVVEKTIEVGKAPVGAWAASNGKMYVDNEEGKSVTEIDVATSSIVSTIPLGFKPGYVAFSGLQNELWVSDSSNGKAVYFSQVNGVWTKKGEIVTGEDAHALAITSDGKKIFVTNQAVNSVSIISLPTHRKEKDILVEGKPNGLAIKD